MIAATESTPTGSSRRLSRLWIGNAEVPTEGRSLTQCLEEIRRQNWELVSASVNPHQHGALCMYQFQRKLLAS